MGFLTLLIAVLLGLLIAVRVLLTVFLLIAADGFFSTLLDKTLAGLGTDSLTTVGFAVMIAFSEASFI